MKKEVSKRASVCIKKARSRLARERPGPIIGNNMGNQNPYYRSDLRELREVGSVLPMSC